MITAMPLVKPVTTDKGLLDDPTEAGEAMAMSMKPARTVQMVNPSTPCAGHVADQDTKRSRPPIWTRLPPRRR